MQSRIYIPASILILLIAFIGFWPTYFGLILKGKVDGNMLLHLHVIIQVTWLACFIFQALLAASGRIALHIKIGPWLMLFGVILIIVGLMLTFERFGAAIVSNNLLKGQRKLFGSLRDLTFFAPFLAAGWIWRHQSEIHKRLMLVATNILVLPAVTRMGFLGRPVPEWEFMIVWPLPIYLAMISDGVMKKTLHPVFIIGWLVMLFMRLCLPLRDTEAWLKFSGWIAKQFVQ